MALLPAMLDLVTAATTAAHALTTIASELTALREHLTTDRPWLTTSEAAAYLHVSRETLDRLAAEHPDLDTGPADIGTTRANRRWHRDALDDWFRAVCARRRGAVEKPARPRQSKPTSKPDSYRRVDWSSV